MPLSRKPLTKTGHNLSPGAINNFHIEVLTIGRVLPDYPSLAMSITLSLPVALVGQSLLNQPKEPFGFGPT